MDFGRLFQLGCYFLNLFGEHRRALLRILKGGTQPDHAVTGQAQAGIAQIRLHSGCTLGGLRLARQRFELFAQLIGQVLQAIQIGLHARELALRFFFAAAVLEHARGFFDIGAAILRAGFQNLRQLSLAHDDVHLPANTGIRQQFLDIHEAHFRPINLIFARTIPEHAAGDGNLRILDGQGTIRVVDGERYLGAAEGLAVTGTGKDDVLHLAAAQRLGAAFTHDPRERVDDIRFTRAIRTHHGADTGLEFQVRRGREGLESFERARFEMHSTKFSAR